MYTMYNPFGFNLSLSFSLSFGLVTVYFVYQVFQSTGGQTDNRWGQI